MCKPENLPLETNPSQVSRHSNRLIDALMINTLILFRMFVKYLTVIELCVTVVALSTQPPLTIISTCTLQASAYPSTPVHEQDSPYLWWLDNKLCYSSYILLKRRKMEVYWLLSELHASPWKGDFCQRKIMKWKTALPSISLPYERKIKPGTKDCGRHGWVTMNEK